MHLAPNLRVAIIVQARMGASRLPGKPLKTVFRKPLLTYLLERLKRCKEAGQIVVATTISKKDDPIAALAKRENVVLVRGSENDVLSRYLLAAEQVSCDVIVRITADCPLIDPKLLDAMLIAFKKTSGLDYLSNTLNRTYPRGMDIEIFTMDALKRAVKGAQSAEEREHVTLHIYRNPDSFKIQNYQGEQDFSNYRWTVDTQEDLLLVRKLIQGLYQKNPEFGLKDLLELMACHPKWEEINKNVIQKRVS